jgi:hypothetical protein
MIFMVTKLLILDRPIKMQIGIKNVVKTTKNKEIPSIPI